MLPRMLKSHSHDAEFAETERRRRAKMMKGEVSSTRPTGTNLSSTLSEPGCSFCKSCAGNTIVYCIANSPSLWWLQFHNRSHYELPGITPFHPKSCKCLQ